MGYGVLISYKCIRSAFVQHFALSGKIIIYLSPNEVLASEHHWANLASISL